MSIIQFQLRRDTAANWTTANPTLLAGEFGFETNTGAIKIGDGSTAWASLSYYSTKIRTAAGAPAGSLGVVGDLYINSTNGDFYLKTGVSAYTLQSNLTGPTGATGPTGPSGGVNTFNGRSGAVSPVQADYDGFFLTPAEGNAAYDAIGAASAAQAASQPLDADLTAIAAVAAQTGFGQGLLATTATTLTALLNSATAALKGLMSPLQFLRLSVQPRNLMSDIPGGTNVKADGIYRLDATMASGASVINSAGAVFTAADLGKVCGMNGAGIGGATLYGTITSFNSATQVGVSFQASTTVAASGVFIYGTDDLAALNAAIADGGRWIMPDWNEVNNLATRMLLSNAPNPITQPNTQLLGSGGITNYDTGFNERGNFIHIMRSNNPNTASATLGVTQLTNPALSFSAVIGSGNQAQKGVKIDGWTIEAAGNVPIGVRGTSSQKGYVGDIHVKNPAYRAYDFTTVGGALGEATDYSKNLHERLSARCLDGSSAATTANGAVANLFANANLVLTNASTGGFSASGGLGIAMTTIGGQIRPTLFSYTGISTNTLTGIVSLYTVAGQSAALASGAVVAPAGPFYADGFVLDGDPNSQNAGAGNVPGNASLNQFIDCSIVHANGMARRYLNADSNKWIGFSVNRASGATGVGCGYFGASSAVNTARNNTDYGGDPGNGGAVIYGPEMTGITASPLANSWDKYELGNGAPRPASGTGAVLTTSDFAVTYNGGIIPALFNRSQNATGNAATVGGAGTATTGQVPGMFVIVPPQGPATTTSGEFDVTLQKTAAGTSVQLGIKYGTTNTAADATVSTQPVAMAGTAIAENITIRLKWALTVIGASASLSVTPTFEGRSLGPAAITGWFSTALLYGSANVPWTAATFNSGLANPGPAYLGLYVLANTGTIITALPGSVSKVNTA